MMVTLKWRIKYIEEIIGDDLIHLKLILIYWMESTHMLKMTMLKKKIKVDMLTPSLDEYGSYGIWFWRKSTQVVQTRFSFDLELIGMPYYIKRDASCW